MVGKRESRESVLSARREVDNGMYLIKQRINLVIFTNICISMSLNNHRQQFLGAAEKFGLV